VSELLLSRTLDPADYELLKEELKVVDAHGIEGQHEHRRWEYALALHAVWRWQQRGGKLHDSLYDIGGAGSKFHLMLCEWCDVDTKVIDPRENTGTVENFVRAGAALADVVTCLSVIEHVEDVDHFLYTLSCLVAPGGLVVLTMDYWNRCGADTAHFNHMRQRIYCPKSYANLRLQCTPLHLHTFGGVDPSYHGANVYDYTFASLVLEKQR